MASELGERKLAAILVSDVVGYSRLAGRDEELTLARLKALRSDLIDPIIAVHRGRVVKRTGDGAIVEFRSVVDAVRCAIETQNGIIERNIGVPPERRIEFRIGIHLGDVMEESDGDLMGDGVNIAARLEGICPPNGVCLSEDAYRQVRSRLDLAVTDLGNKELKNIAEPVRVYSLTVGVPAQAKPVTPAAAPKRTRSKLLIPVISGLAALLVIAAVAAWYFLIRPGANIAANAPAHLSIVVLPFANLSNDPKQDYFADGITDNLTTDLSRIRNSFVIARNTAFTYKGKNVDAKEIGKELGVRYVLEGSVQREGNQVRVNAQLIDAESGAHLWADRFEEDLADLFKLQDDVVARLANQLDSELIAAAAVHAEKAASPDTIDLYFQGMARFNMGGPTNLKDAHEFFERALALDPGNIDAMVGMASVDAMIGSRFFTEDRAARLAAAEEALAKVLSQAPEYALAHMWLGVVQIYTNRAGQGIAECERALALDQNLADAHAYIGFGKYASGHGEETEAHVREALRLSPRDTAAYSWMTIAGSVKEGLGADEEAVAWLHRAIEANRNFPLSHLFLASALAQLGRLDEARAEARAGLTLDPTFTVRRFRAGSSSDNPRYLAQHERLAEGMRKAGLPEEAAPPPPKHLSIVVLPFDNLSGDRKQDYFADGITDNLTTDLSRIRNSFVIARNTAFTYKGKAVDAKEIGKELSVRYVLEGSVARDGNRVRVNAQLIDAESGSHLWADRFEEGLADLFKLQDDVVARLANALGYELVTAEAAKGADSANPDAIDLTMQGWSKIHEIGAKGSKDALEATRAIFQKALKLDANNLQALLGIANVDAIEFSTVVEAVPGRDRTATTYLNHALEIDPQSANAHYIRAYLFFYLKKLDDSVAEARKAIELDANFPLGYVQLAATQTSLGDNDAAIANIERAMVLSPRDPDIGFYHFVKAKALLFSHRNHPAVAEFREAERDGFHIFIAPLLIASALALDDEVDSAKEEVARARKMDPAITISWLKKRVVYPEFVYDGMSKAGLPEDEGPRLSIVVLPFNNIGDPAQAYIADAITEELTTALSKLRDSFVIARNTAMTYRGKPVDAKEIGKELGVRYVLEGSAQRGGDRVRVTAQLIDTETGAHLWADQFDQPRAELLDMQDAIVARLGRALELKLTDADISRTQRTRPGNLDAEDLALRCWSESEEFFTEPAKLHEAYGLCEQAVALDPRNVTALGILAWRAIEPVVLLRSTDPASDIRKAQNLVSRSFAVDPNDFAAHYVNAWIDAAQGQFEQEDIEAGRCLNSNPNYVACYLPQCYANNYLGKPAKAIECVDKAMRLSPRDPFANFFYLQKGFAQLQLDRYAGAIETLRLAVSLTPNDAVTKDQLAYNIVAGVAAAQSVNREEDIREVNAIADQSLAINPNDFFARLAKAQALIQQDKLNEALGVMAPIPPGIRLIYFVYHAKCDALAQLGRADDTIACADKLIALGPHQNLHAEYLDKGWGLMLLHKDEDAATAFRHAIEVRSTASFPRAFLAAVLGETGHTPEAKEALARYLAAQGVRMRTVPDWRGYWANWPTQNPTVLDFRKRFLDGLRKAGMPEQ